MKTKQPLENADLDRNEWCFKSIPKREIAACFAYEYFRELARPPHRIEARFLKRALLDCDPNISWQELDQKMRSTLVKLNTLFDSVGSLHMEPERELDGLDITNIKRYRQGFESWQNEFDRERTEYGFFAINWRYPDREIKRRFEQWLSEQREEVKWTEFDYKIKARGGSMDRLNWLGALRVVKHYRKTQLVDYADTNLKVDAPYSHLPDLYKNAKRAGNLLKIIAENLGRS
jgi:hypothetical protein